VLEPENSTTHRKRLFRGDEAQMFDLAVKTAENVRTSDLLLWLDLTSKRHTECHQRLAVTEFRCRIVLIIL